MLPEALARRVLFDKLSKVPKAVPLLLSWPAIALIGLVALPFFLLLRISVAPFDPSRMWAPGITLHAYETLAQATVWRALFNSLELSIIVSALSLALGFPFTYFISLMRHRAQTIWLTVLLATLSLSDVLIAFAWQVMLSKRIGISNLLTVLGLMKSSESLMPSMGAVIACLVYLVLPFTVLTLYPALSRLDRSQIEAARTLGASPLRAFLSVVIPLARGPITIAVLLSTIATMGSYVPPLVLGWPKDWPMAVLIGSTALSGHDLPRASAMSILLLVVTAMLAITISQGNKVRKR